MTLVYCTNDYDVYVSSDSPFSSDQLAKQIVSFEKVKLTNNELDKAGQIVLNSMHKFQPRLHLVVAEPGLGPVTTSQELARHKHKVGRSTASPPPPHLHNIVNHIIMSYRC